MTTLSITEDQALQALRTVLLQILPSGIKIRQGQWNRVAEPLVGDFVLMTPIMKPRLGTNIDEDVDLAFTASIALTVMTVTAVELGTIIDGAELFSSAVPLAVLATVGAQLTGTPGGVGTYTVAPSQTFASGLLCGGVHAMTQPVQYTVQLDIHGDNSGNNAQRISTVLRDSLGCDLFAAVRDTTGIDVATLYSEDPRQVPFTNAEQQIEWRWTVDAVLEIKPTLTTQQQFASTVTVGLIEVDEAYPPGV